jgi:hypothetical protein
MSPTSRFAYDDTAPARSPATVCAWRSLPHDLPPWGRSSRHSLTAFNGTVNGHGDYDQDHDSEGRLRS